MTGALPAAANNLFEIAGAFAQDAGKMTAKQRKRELSPFQQLAWVYRFGTEEQFRQAVAEANPSILAGENSDV